MLPQSLFQFRIVDLIDIILVAILFYQLYRLVKGTIAVNILIGIIAVYILWIFVKAMDMQLLESLLGKFIGVGVITIIIVFQQEIRRFLLLVGSNDFIRNFSNKISLATTTKDIKHPLDLLSLVKACKLMSDSKTGAIIVLTKNSTLDFYLNTGDLLSAKLNTRLLESIFFKNNPLHDGAVVITDNVIMAARCVLPVTEKDDFPAHLGMRHRAAVGVTENSDALAIVVSEQTGDISYCKEGELKLQLSIQQLSKLLESEFN